MIEKRQLEKREREGKEEEKLFPVHDLRLDGKVNDEKRSEMMMIKWH